MGHLAVLEKLIESGAVVNDAENAKGTPLYVASFYGRVEVVAALLKAGADADAAGVKGQTPLFVAS